MKKLTEKYIISTIDDETGKRMYWNNSDGVWYYRQSQGTTYENYDEANLDVPEADLNLPSDSIYPVEVLEGSKRWSKMKESTDKKVPGMKWWRDGDVYEPNFFSSRRGPGVDAKAVDEELDSIIKKYDNCFPVKDDLTFEIEYWDTFNGDNVSVTFVFNRDFEGDEFKEIKDLLDNKLLKEFGFGDSDVHGTGWNSKRHAREWILCWYKYSDYNKDHTFKRPNPLDSNTKGGQINGTEPFTLEEGKEISKVVMEYIVELFKANPAGVYYRPSKAIKTVEIPEHRLRPFTPSWKGSYTHNTGWLGFSCYIEDAYDENATDWRGQKGDYYRADEGIITALLRNKAAETLNDFLYEFNLEVVPEDCEAHWYHGSEEDEANGVLFEVNIEFKEIGVDSIESYYSHKGNSFKSYFDWDEEGVKDLYKGKTFKRNPKRIKEGVLDYDTWDKYYDEGAEAYFEGKTLSDVPITGNAWFKEAWEEGWKNAKACDDEDTKRAEAEYEEELEWEEACREGLTESKNLNERVMTAEEADFHEGDYYKNRYGWVIIIEELDGDYVHIKQYLDTNPDNYSTHMKAIPLLYEHLMNYHFTKLKNINDEKLTEKRILSDEFDLGWDKAELKNAFKNIGCKLKFWKYSAEPYFTIYYNDSPVGNLVPGRANEYYELSFTGDIDCSGMKPSGPSMKWAGNGIEELKADCQDFYENAVAKMRK